MKGAILTHTETLHIKERLWGMTRPAPGGGLYALVDCARSRLAFPILEASRLESRCLYDGVVTRPLLEAAPHLIQLERERVFDMDIIANGWGNSWGIYLQSSVGLAETRRHLRRFLRVKDETGKVLLFRYYDPRVLRVYLPSCTPEELRTFFGPIQEIFLESPDGHEIFGLSVDGGGKLARRATPLLLSVGDAAPLRPAH